MLINWLETHDNEAERESVFISDYFFLKFLYNKNIFIMKVQFVIALRYIIHTYCEYQHALI